MHNIYYLGLSCEQSLPFGLLVFFFLFFFFFFFFCGGGGLWLLVCLTLGDLRRPTVGRLLMKNKPLKLGRLSAILAF